MKSFTDKHGLMWEIERTPAIVDELARTLALPPGSAAFWFRMCDPATLVDTLYTVCRQQAERRQITDVAFGVALANADTIKAAADALAQAFTTGTP